MIIKNYSGDMMNFQNAAFLTETDGINVDYVKVDDDIVVEDSLYTVGRRGVAGAVVGDKTLIDALVPCADSWVTNATKQQSMQQAFVQGAKAAVDGAKTTELIAARMGRAGTVGECSIGYPDAGAHALGVIFTELTAKLSFI